MGSWPAGQRARVIIVGGMPQPSGGVTVFLSRLVERLGGIFDFVVLDLTPGHKDPSLAAAHMITPWRSGLRYLWLLIRLLSFRDGVLHFNFSSCRSLVLFCLFPQTGKTRIALTLHHGDQEGRFQNASLLTRRVIRSCAKRVHVFVAISKAQAKFYEDVLGVDPGRIVHIPSSIPPKKRNYDARDLPVSFAAFRARQRSVLASSGYMTRTCNFEAVIDCARSLGGAGVVLCTYGLQRDDVYERELKELSDAGGEVLFLRDLNEVQFLNVLGRCDVYVRPTKVDSWGVAVGDAIALGIPAVASDVCERHPGALVYQANNLEALRESVAYAVGKGKKEAASRAGDDAALAYERLYRALHNGANG